MLLDHVSLSSQIMSIVVFMLTLSVVRYLPRLRKAVLYHESSLPGAAVIVIDGLASNAKRDLIQSLRVRFKANTRPFMLVSHDDVERLFCAETYRDALKSDSKHSRLISGLHRSWAALVSSGNNLIVDFKDLAFWDSFLEHFEAKTTLLLRLPGSMLPLKGVHQVTSPDADSVARRLAVLKLI